MNKLKIAICMEEGEYLKRLSGCLINHYKNYMEFHIFTNLEQLAEENHEAYQGFLIGDFPIEDSKISWIPGEKILYLREDEADIQEEGPIHELSKYEEIPKIADMLGVLAGKKEVFLREIKEKSHKIEQFGVFSLNVPHLQLPFVFLLGNIMAEKKKTLLIDLQENSGLGSGEPCASGMEDLMAMAKTQKYTRGRLISAMGHYQQWDYIYPVRNSECLCEGEYELYKSMLQMVIKEMDYEVIIINFGVRFQGFFQLISDCKDCFLLGDENKKNWREEAFYEEIEKREGKSIGNKFIRVDVPLNQSITTSPQRLAEQWMWSQTGEMLRRVVGKESYGG